MSRVFWKKKADIAYCWHEAEPLKNAFSAGRASYDTRGAVVG